MLATFSSCSFAQGHVTSKSTSTSTSTSPSTPSTPPPTASGVSKNNSMLLMVVGDPESTFLICLKYAFKYSYGGQNVAPRKCAAENWQNGCGYSVACNPPTTFGIPRPSYGESYTMEMVISDNPADPCYNASTWVHITCNVTSSSCPNGVCKITATEQNSYSGDSFVNAHSIGFGSSTGLLCSKTPGQFFGYKPPNPKGYIACSSHH